MRQILITLILGAFVLFNLVFAQVTSPTLRDEVRQKGYAWHTTILDFRTLATFDDLITRSDLIVRGRVVDERTHLTSNEDGVLTDYTIEVLEVFKDPQHLGSVGGKLAVSKEGGNALIDGKPVRVDTPQFSPIPWIAPQVFFIRRLEPEGSNYFFTGGGIGVFAIEKNKIVCASAEQLRNPVSKQFCGSAESDFLQLLKEKIAALGKQSSRP